jgi:hypothetical protein
LWRWRLWYFIVVIVFIVAWRALWLWLLTDWTEWKSRGFLKLFVIGIDWVIVVLLCYLCEIVVIAVELSNAVNIEFFITAFINKIFICCLITCLNITNTYFWPTDSINLTRTNLIRYTAVISLQNSWRYRTAIIWWWQASPINTITTLYIYNTSIRCRS